MEEVSRKGRKERKRDELPKMRKVEGGREKMKREERRGN